jgi:hypothetical protein
MLENTVFLGLDHKIFNPMKAMFKTFFFLSFIALVGVGCKQDPPQDEAPDTPVSDEVITDAQVVSSEGLPLVPNGTGQVSQQTLSLIENFTTDYWYVEQWAEINQSSFDADAARENRGRWFKFSKDGNVVLGQLDQEQGAGTWTYDPQNALVFIDVEDGDNMEFSVKWRATGR